MRSEMRGSRPPSPDAIGPATPRAETRVLRAAGGSASRERLLRETKRAAKVSHEGLAVVFEVGETEAGDVFVSVEKIEGERLSDRLRAGALPEREAASIAAQIARAIAAAHDAGVVHRDLRPSLIALEGKGDETRVKVEGLTTPRHASVVGASEDDAEVAYAAPERAGAREPVGRRADVYSIGAMLYAMLTGRVFDAENPIAIDGPLADVVKRCLATDPRERFLDTVALAAALRLAMEPGPRPSKRPSSRPDPERPPSSPPAPARARRSRRR
jgi:eukaryotic-like serine/threonine-protein kinase